MGEFESEVADFGFSLVGIQVEGKVFERQSGRFVECKFLDGSVYHAVLYSPYYYIRAYVAQRDMVFVEQVGCTGLVVLVIAYGSVSYYKGVDAQGQLAFRLAFRREGVNDELAVQLVRGLGFVYVGFHSEHLS